MDSWIARKAKFKPRKTDTLTEKILKIRGISEDDIDDFLYPNDLHEYDYKMIKDIEKAVDICVQHINDNSNITISGDPDADGVTSLAILHNFLRDNFQADPQYIYGQREYGHGVSAQLILQDSDDESYVGLVKNNNEILSNTDLLIICDSSSSDTGGLDYIRSNYPDCDIIILDHHDFMDKETEDYMLSLDKLTLVNIQRTDDKSPNKHLSGAGVVYKFIKGIYESYDNLLNAPEYYLDLVAVGLIGDVMNVGNMENRYLISCGLDNVHNVGLTRILKGAKVDMYNYNSKDVGFSVAPLINASARMGQIELSIDILLTTEDKEAKSLRLKMDKLNKQRQELQRTIAEKYEGNIDVNDKVIFVIDNESNKGFNGLVAQSLAQKYKRPCFVVRKIDGMCYGSGRSYGNINTNTLFDELQYVVTQGHAQSHGIEFPFDKLEEMKQYANENIKDDGKDFNVIVYDTELETNDDLMWNIEEVQSLNYITGNGFPEVNVALSGLCIEDRSVIGKTNETVKFTCDNGLVLIKFKVDEDWHKEIDTLDIVNVVGVPNINRFYNFATKETTVTPQIIIQDIVKE